MARSSVAGRQGRQAPLAWLLGPGLESSQRVWGAFDATWPPKAGSRSSAGGHVGAPHATRRIEPLGRSDGPGPAKALLSCDREQMRADGQDFRGLHALVLCADG